MIHTSVELKALNLTNNMLNVISKINYKTPELNSFIKNENKRLSKELKTYSHLVGKVVLKPNNYYNTSPIPTTISEITCFGCNSVIVQIKYDRDGGYDYIDVNRLTFL